MWNIIMLEFFLLGKVFFSKHRDGTLYFDTKRINLQHNF